MVEGMKKAGNRKANRYWERNLPAGFPRPYDARTRERFIRDKYELGKYKGTPAPITATTTTTTTSSTSSDTTESTPAVMATASDANAKGSDGIVNGRRRRRNPNGMVSGGGANGDVEDTMDIMGNEHPTKPPKPPAVQEQALNIAIMQGEIDMFQNLTLKGSSSSSQQNIQSGSKKANGDEEINLLMMDNYENDNNNNNNDGNGNDNNAIISEQESSATANGDSSISADIQSLVQPSNTDITNNTSQPAKPTLSTADIMAAYNQPQMQMYAPAYYVNNGAVAYPAMQYPGNMTQQYQQQYVPEQQLQQLQQIQQMQQLQQQQQQQQYINNHAQPLSVSPILIDSHQGNGNSVAEYASQQSTESAFGFLGGSSTTPIVAEPKQSLIDPRIHLENVKQEIQQIENQLQAANDLLSKFDQIKQDLLIARGNIAKMHGEIEKIQGNKLDGMSSDTFQSLPDSANIVSLRKDLSSKASNLSLLLEDFYQRSSASLQKSA